MMGTQDRQQPLFYGGFSLDDRVRPDDPLRQVKEHIDFSFVRREVVSLYGQETVPDTFAVPFAVPGRYDELRPPLIPTALPHWAA